MEAGLNSPAARSRIDVVGHNMTNEDELSMQMQGFPIKISEY
jgi:hypothetical protein